MGIYLPCLFRPRLDGNLINPPPVIMKISTPKNAIESSRKVCKEVDFSSEHPNYSPNTQADEALWRESVELWMQWHAGQEKLTTAMFACRHLPAEQAELMQEMDHLDQLRWRAVEISQELLSATPV